LLSLSLAASLLGGAPAAGDVDADREIARAVQDQLRLSAVVGRFLIDPSVQDGKVVLTGSVDTLAQSLEAIDRAGHARGVVDVRSQLRVGRGSRRDGEIASDIRRRFQDIPDVAALGIEVDVRQGVATLSGKLEDARVRFAAIDAAAEVRGVTEVADRLESAPREDAEILASATGVLGRRSIARISGRVETTVEHGVVTLEGTVTRFSEKRRAARLVLGINGVKAVDDRLRVERSSPDLEISLDPPR